VARSFLDLAQTQPRDGTVDGPSADLGSHHPGHGDDVQYSRADVAGPALRQKNGRGVKVVEHSVPLNVYGLESERSAVAPGAE